LDESIFPIKPYLTYGWFIQGSHPVVKYEHKRREKYCVLGALNSSNFIYQISEKLNSDVFQIFVLQLISEFKKVVIVIDHGSYHVSKITQEFYIQHKEHLHVEYFPSYSPELDPIEETWRETKKWLAIRNWDDKDGLREQLISAFQQDFVKIPIYDYLRT
jgi:transposase